MTINLISQLITVGSNFFILNDFLLIYRTSLGRGFTIPLGQITEKYKIDRKLVDNSKNS